MAGMIYLKGGSIPLRALLCIYGFALAVGYLRWRGTTRGKVALSTKSKWFTFGFALAVFLLIHPKQAPRTSAILKFATRFQN
jgi:hypothetical protein